MQRWVSQRRTSLPQLVLIAVVTFALIIGVDFGRRLSLNRRIAADYAQLSSEVEALRAQQVQLQAQKAHVESDDYVQDWARAQAKLVRPGEHLVVPLTNPSGGASTTTRNTNSATPEPIWHAWWSLLFDRPAPDWNLHFP